MGQKAKDKFTINALSRLEQMREQAKEMDKQNLSRQQIEDYIKEVAAANDGEVSFDGPRTMHDMPPGLMRRWMKEVEQYGNLLESTQKEIARYGITFKDPGLREVNDIYTILPLEDARLRAIYTSLNTISVMIETITRELEDRLTAAGAKKFKMAQDFKVLSTWASKQSQAVIDKLIAMEEEGFYPLNFQLKAVDKFVGQLSIFLETHEDNEENAKIFVEQFIQWYTHITRISNTNQYEQELLDSVDFIFRLKPKDQFCFVRGEFGKKSMDYKEFEFIGIDNDNKAWYKDRYDSYWCDPYSPIIKVWSAS